MITGTSAGSMAGAITALGRDLPALVARRTAGLTMPDAPSAPAGDTPTAAISPELLDLMRPGAATVTELAARGLPVARVTDGPDFASVAAATGPGSGRRHSAGAPTRRGKRR